MESTETVDSRTKFLLKLKFTLRVIYSVSSTYANKGSLTYIPSAKKI